jgi:hypothetical protein
MSRIRWIVVGLAMLAITISVPAQVPQDSVTRHQAHHPAVSGETQKPDMMSHCREMMAQQQAMTERRKQMNEKLDALVRDMNRAQSKDQVARIVAVINEMVAQRQAMDQMMTMMQQHSMMPSMDHAQGGMAMECPMMKQMQEKIEAGKSKP